MPETEFEKMERISAAVKARETPAPLTDLAKTNRYKATKLKHEVADVVKKLIEQYEEETGLKVERITCSSIYTRVESGNVARREFEFHITI